MAEAKSQQPSIQTRNLVVLAVAALALGLSFVVQSPYMAYSLYTFLLLLGLAHFSSLAWISGLECERTVSHTLVQQGDEISVTLTVRNQRGIPIPWIYVEDAAPLGFPVTGQNKCLTTLMPGREITLRYTVGCPRRGYHSIGPLLMESGDFFGLQKRFKTGQRQDYVSVLPTIAYIDTFNIAAKRPQGPIRISNRIYEDPTRISNLREYRPGDALNTIHWKATARTGTLYVKTHEPSSVTGGTLILDLHQDSYKPEDKEARMELAITTTASIAYLLQMSGEQVGMLTNAGDAAEVARYELDSHQATSRNEIDEQIREGDAAITTISPLSVSTLRGQGQAYKIAENLARVVPGRGLDAEQMLFSQSMMLPRDAALLPVLPQLTERMAWILADLKQTGYNVTVFIIRDLAAFKEAALLLAPHHINVLHIEHTRNLHEISPAAIGR